MLKDTTDSTLASWIQATALHEQPAFENLYSATSPYVFGVLRRILRTESLAEEALQEVFVKVWNKAGSYQPQKSAPLTWIISIARHHAIDELRKRSVREDLEVVVDSSDMAQLPQKNTSYATQHEQSQQLDLCLEQLNATAKECVIRAYCEGFTYEELSKKTQHPVNTIKSWVRRSLLSLKECLDGLQ